MRFRLRRRLALRRATAADAAAMAAILSDWIDATPWMPRIHSHDDDRGFAEHLVADMTVTVAARGRDVTGFLARRDGFIHALYLAPAERGRGTGARLLGAAQAEAGELTLWTFQANTAARAFYARAGFAEVEATDGSGNDEHLPDVRLVWTAQAVRPEPGRVTQFRDQDAAGIERRHGDGRA